MKHLTCNSLKALQWHDPFFFIQKDENNPTKLQVKKAYISSYEPCIRTIFADAQLIEFPLDYKILFQDAFAKEKDALQEAIKRTETHIANLQVQSSKFINRLAPIKEKP